MSRLSGAQTDSAGAQRHKHVFQKPVERWRRELADARAWSGFDSLDLPTHEVVDAFEPSENRFWFSG